MSEDRSSKKLLNGLNPELVKTLLAIVVQSVAIGFYLSGVSSGIANLTENFVEFKVEIKKDIDKLKASYEDMAAIKVRIITLTDSNEKESKKLTDLEEKFQTTRDQVRDNARAIQDLRELTNKLVEVKIASQNSANRPK